VASGAEKSEDTFSRFDIILACDGQTDGQTSCAAMVRAMHNIARYKLKYRKTLRHIQLISHNLT